MVVLLRLPLVERMAAQSKRCQSEDSLRRLKADGFARGGLVMGSGMPPWLPTTNSQTKEWNFGSRSRMTLVLCTDWVVTQRITRTRFAPHTDHGVRSGHADVAADSETPTVSEMDRAILDTVRSHPLYT
jgi:hypothetical protein